MNFKELVDSGEYSRDDLDETQNAYIDGLSESVQCAKDLIEMMKEDLNDGTLLSEISAQEKETFVKQFEDYMDTVSRLLRWRIRTMNRIHVSHSVLCRDSLSQIT